MTSVPIVENTQMYMTNPQTSMRRWGFGTPSWRDRWVYDCWGSTLLETMIIMIVAYIPFMMLLFWLDEKDL